MCQTVPNSGKGPEISPDWGRIFLPIAPDTAARFRDRAERHRFKRDPIKHDSHPGADQAPLPVLLPCGEEGPPFEFVMRLYRNQEKRLVETHQPNAIRTGRVSFHRLAWDLSPPLVRVGMVLDAGGLLALALSVFCLLAASVVSDEAVLGHSLRGCLLALRGGIVLLGVARVFDLIDIFVNGTDPRQAALDACQGAAFADAAVAHCVARPPTWTAVGTPRLSPDKPVPSAAIAARNHGLLRRRPRRPRRDPDNVSTPPQFQHVPKNLPR